MKRQFLLMRLLLLFALIVGSSSAWAGDIINETFSSGLPTGWSADAKGGGSTTGASTSDSNGRTDSHCWKLGTNNNPYGSITTSSLNITGNAVLTFWTKAKNSKTPVLLVTGTNCTLTGDYSATAANDNTYKKFTVNITNVTGGVTLTFKHNSPSAGSYIYLDDIVITSAHTITYDATNGSIGGIVYNTSTVVASGASIVEGGKVTLTAAPADGYSFNRWSVSGDGSSISSITDNPVTFTMGTENATVTANFVSASSPKYYVTFSAPDNGTLVVKKGDDAINSGDEIADGTILNIVATPASGYNLVKWEFKEDGGSWTDGEGTSYTINGKDVEFRASFVAKVYHTITYSVNGVETETEIEEGKAISFAAPASGIPTGYKFTGWVVAANKIDSPTDTDPKANYVTSATCSSDITYYAVLAISEYTTPTLTKMGSSDTFNADDNIVIVAKGTTYALYQETVSTSYVKNWTFDNAVSTLNADNKKYLTLSSNSDEWYLGDKTNGYLYNGSSNNLALSDSKSSWTINWNSTHKAFTIETNSKYLSCRSDLTGDNQYKYRMLGNTDSGIGFFDIYKFVPSKDGHFCTTVSDVPTKVGAKGYATYCNSSVALDFTGKSIKAYVVKSTDGSALTLTQVNKVAKNTPLLLYSATNSDSQSIPAIADSETMDDVTGNKLKAGTGAAVTWEEGTTEYYILYTGGDKPGFYRANNSTVAVGKAYLDLTGVSGSREFFSFFDDETTGINAIDVENANAEVKNNVYYNLNGQRVANPSKGLYIVNGKKVIMK